jgi:hypothetical protein
MAEVAEGLTFQLCKNQVVKVGGQAAFAEWQLLTPTRQRCCCLRQVLEFAPKP